MALRNEVSVERSESPKIRRCISNPSRRDFRSIVERALDGIAADNYEKIVVSRTLEPELDSSISIDWMLRQLSRQFASGHLFALRGGVDGCDSPGSWIVGATPELLLSRRGRIVRSTPLAGSVPRSPDPNEDQRRAQSLIASEKDMREHAYVVESIAQRLRPHCPDLWVPKKPALVATPTMWHLGSDITGTLTSTGPSSLELARLLHPTPAVCGYPADAAYAAIGELEPHDRSLFCGMVGWNDEHGDGEWAVTIRCAEVEGPRARLYAGVGIVDGSSPLLELQETDAKLGTMMSAMNLEHREAGESGAWGHVQ